MAEAIHTEGLSKRYGETVALDSLDLSVREGEVYGYLGPNGAGKTTTIRLLLGLHRPSAGRAELFGLDAWRRPVSAHRRVAYVPGEPFLWPKMTSAETFEFLARLHGDTDARYRDVLVERFKLDTSKRVRALSKGNRQKVQLVAALATRADLLILDEPTSGLDPLMEVAFRESVHEAKERGQTVFLSSHILSEVEALCDQVGILSNGKLVDEDVPEGLNQQLQKLGTGSVTTASGYLAFSFLFFILLVCLFGCSQIAAARHEEDDEQLETLFAQPVSRRAWLAGRLALAAGGAALVALAIGLLTWIGAAAAGADVSFGDMVGAGANCLPIALLFLGLGALAFAIVPRATAGISYGLVLVAFVWQLFGSLLDLPGWTVNLSPFHQVALVPSQDFKATAAVVMLAIAVAASFAAVRLFERRDLVGA